MQDDDAATLYATMRPASGGKSLVTLSTYQERQEALKRTTMMEDDTSHRTSRHYTNGNSAHVVNDVVDGYHQQQHHQQQQQQQHQTNQSSSHIPPPPPQFANSPPKDNKQTNGIYNYQTIKRANGVTTASKNATNTKATLKPPSSPIPDYDNLQQQQQSKEDKRLQINSLKAVPKQNGNKMNSNSNTTAPISTSTSTTTATVVPPSPTRRTIRLGAVTIGEYEQQRKEPNKFEFIGGQNGSSFQNELQNTLSRSKLKNGGGTNQHHQHQLEHKRDCPLRNNFGAENSTATVKRNSSSGNVYNSAGPGHNGILKNGNSRNSGGGVNGGLNGHSSKISEKTITFGN